MASEHPEGISAATEWIDRPDPLLGVAGWSALAAIVSVVPDAKLPMPQLEKLLQRCVETIHQSPNRVRYSMNSFVICVGTYVAPLAEMAMTAAKKIGLVEVDMLDTDCKVPDAAPYILKCRKGLPVAAKKKTAKC